MKKKILYILIMVIPIVCGSFMTLDQPTCDQKGIDICFRNLDDMPGYIKTDSSKYMPFPSTANKKVYLTFKDDTITKRDTVAKLDFDPMVESRRYTASGIFFAAIFSSATKIRSYFFLKGKDLADLIPGLKDLYYKVKIDRQNKRLLIEYPDKNGMPVYAEYYPETGKSCPEELLVPKQTPKNKTIL
jgi:hypothetical protein